MKLYTYLITILFIISVAGNIVIIYKLENSPTLTGFVVALITPLLRVVVDEYKKKKQKKKEQLENQENQNNIPEQ